MIDQNEFINAYIQRMLALNSDLTNKNVMLETRYSLLEKKFNELALVYNTLKEKYEPSAELPDGLHLEGSQEPVSAERINKKTSSKEEQF
jgi:hypothetical protein